nr:MAG TPA: hypothetical protein [Caudoviricetes sp.]
MISSLILAYRMMMMESIRSIELIERNMMLFMKLKLMHLLTPKLIVMRRRKCGLVR